MSFIDVLSEARGAGRLLAGAARVAVLQASRRAHPIVEGRLTVDGCDGMLEVLRDRYGVPHVFATSEGDALFGQGLVHAQDRLFQMEALRRLAAGRLAEILGPRVLAADRFHRRLGLAKLAHRDVVDAASEDRTALEAYARGVNAGLATLRALPPEFALLGFDPEPWQAWHSALVGRLLLFTFATNWDTELLREELLRLLGPERAAVSESGLRVSSADGERSTSGSYVPGVLERLLAAHRAAQKAGVAVGFPTGGGASNAFAVGPGRSTTGAPLLAADPHLPPRLPGFFHLVHLAGGGLNVVGADVAGLPGVAMGHNGDLAWGLTAGLADVADCYVEELDPADPGRYLTPEGWETGRWRLETITVRGAAPVEERVLETRHGPVIGPALPGERRAIALHATPLQPSDAVSPFLTLGRARKIEVFEAALERWPGSTFNVIYAHVDGQIGYQLAGQVPIREHGQGLLPQLGARSSGPPPSRAASELPRLNNPASGVVFSANEAPNSLLELGEEWAEPWRALRIEQLLAERELHDTSSLAGIQLDLHSEPMSRLRDWLLAACSASVEGIEILGDEAVAGTAGTPRLDAEVSEFLKSWDARLEATSPGAAIIQAVFLELANTVTRRVAGPAASVLLGRGYYDGQPHSSFHYRLQGWLIDLLDEPALPAFQNVADRDRLLRAALGRVIRQLRVKLGSEPASWRWGDIHRLRLPHTLAEMPVLGGRWSRGPFAIGGDVNTVCQAGYNISLGSEEAAIVPAYRQIVDLGNPDRSQAQLPTGASGIPGHPRYDDCVAEMLAGRYRPLLFSRSAVEAALESRLQLIPGSPPSEHRSGAQVAA